MVNDNTNMRVGFLFLGLFLLEGCANEPLNSYDPSAPAVSQQSVALLQAQAASSKLQVGMSREQVRDILGNPSRTEKILDLEWDYEFAGQFGMVTKTLKLSFGLDGSYRLQSWYWWE